MAVAKQEQSLVQVLDEICTPDYFGRTVLSTVLRDAAGKLRGNDDYVELSAKIFVSFSEPEARSARTICFHTDGVWICIIPDE
ncbi:hypothetical protein ACFZDB_15290 [Streptomyces luteogriseus]|uniref:hypothetical protein n=1 Tax=Streptomyces TaxID=1883 RepID=UPI0004C647D0|nr:hypothetical protein [Streptomyces sp. NRRL S-475]